MILPMMILSVEYNLKHAEYQSCEMTASISYLSTLVTVLKCVEKSLSINKEKSATGQFDFYFYCMDFWDCFFKPPHHPVPRPRFPGTGGMGSGKNCWIMKHSKLSGG